MTQWVLNKDQDTAEIATVDAEWEMKKRKGVLNIEVLIDTHCYSVEMPAPVLKAILLSEDKT